MDMADVVTYADLKFSENPLREKEPSDNEEDNDQSEVMYENIKLPSREKEAPTAPPVGTSWSQRLKARFQKSSPLLTLLPLVLCLAAATVMTVKYISLSRETQLTSAVHVGLSRKLKDHEDLLLSVREELGRSQEELKRSQEEMKRSQEELGRSQEELKKSQEELRKNQKELGRSQEELKGSQEKQREAETKQNEVASRLNTIQKELCGEDWTLFGRRCLSFSYDSKSWSGCRTFCERKKSNLLVVKKEDTELQNLLSERQTDYWVGKEVKNSRTARWDWPSGYRISDYWICGKVKAGELDNDSCYFSNYCVCERSLVLVEGLSEYSPESSEMVLWGNKYKCFLQYK